MTLPLRIILAVLLTMASATRAAEKPPDVEWRNISDPVVNKLAAEGKKLDWPYQTAGVACDPANGDVFLVLPGQGIWKSSDRGATFARADAGAVGGRCETGFSLNVDPAGGRLGCFMLDGKCALTPDGGRTWRPLADLGRNWDYAAVDWANDAANIFGARHEVGGEAYLSTDGGRTWKLLFKDADFDRAGGLGIFDAKTLVRTWPGKGIERSTDAGATWTKVSDLQPTGRVMKVHRGVAYWFAADGVLTSTDSGATWKKTGDHCPGTTGPLLDPRREGHFLVVGKEGIFETADGGATWTPLARLPPKFDVPKPGWFTNVAWDPGSDTIYASRMGYAAYKWERGSPRAVIVP